MKYTVALFAAVFAAACACAQVADVQTALTLDPQPGNPRNSEGDFIRLENGRILFAYTHFTGSASDFGEAHIAARHSDDNGRTWSEQDEIVLPNEGGMNTMSVSFLRLKSGPIAMFYLRKDSRADCRPYVRFSTDEAASWSEPTLCIDTPGYFVVNNDRVIQLSSGRLVIPAARHSLPGEDFQSRGEAMCYLSDDDGKTWRPSSTILEAPEGSRTGLQEPGVIELADGRVMMLSRTDQGSQFRSYSNDGGETWSEPEPTDIISPVSPASFKRMPESGNILMVWNDHSNISEDLEGKRTPLSLAVSTDEAQTWSEPVNIETDPDGWYCYTAIEFLPDNAALLAYCAGDSEVGRLNRLKIVRLELRE